MTAQEWLTKHGKRPWEIPELSIWFWSFWDESFFPIDDSLIPGEVMPEIYDFLLNTDCYNSEQEAIDDFIQAYNKALEQGFKFD